MDHHMANNASTHNHSETVHADSDNHHGHGDHTGHDMAVNVSDGHSAGHLSAHEGMAMTFHFGYSEHVLFSWWHVQSVAGLVASVAALFLLAVLYEGLKYKREDMLRRQATTSSQLDVIRVPAHSGVTDVATVAPPVVCSGHVTGSRESVHERASSTCRATQCLVASASPHRSDSLSQRMFSWHHCLQTLLHGVQVVLGYMLMLAFMTYNVWLALAITLGAMLGYFVFGSRKFVVVDVTEHCH